MQEEVLAEGTNIGTSLKHLAERRTDIFGTEETVIGMKVRTNQSVCTVYMCCDKCVCLCTLYVWEDTCTDFNINYHVQYECVVLFSSTRFILTLNFSLPKVLTLHSIF